MNKLVTVRAFITALMLAACGDTQNDSQVGDTQNDSQVKKVSETNPLLDSLQRLDVDRQMDSKSGAHSYRVRLSLTLATNQAALYSFQSRSFSPSGISTGYREKLEECADKFCTKLKKDVESKDAVEGKNDEKPVIEATLRCTDGNCKSVFLTIEGKDGEFDGKMVYASAQMIENMNPLLTVQSFVDSPELNRFVNTVQDGSVRKIGVLELTQIHGTKFKKMAIYTKVTPTRFHRDLSRDVKEGDDITAHQKYFERDIGVAVATDFSGDKVSNLFDRSVYPNQNLSQGAYSPVKVSIIWKPFSGQIAISMQDALNYPDDPSQGGTLTFGYTHERLVRPDLGEFETDTVDPLWMF